jgi:PAS domain S-box-containing protein
MSDFTSPGQRDWLRVALDTIGDAVVTTDAQDRVTFMNPAAGRLAGTNGESAQGRPFHDLFRLLDAYTRQPVPIQLDGAADGAVHHLLLVDAAGGERQLDVTVERCKEGDAECSGAVLVLRDVTGTERALRLEEELRRRVDDLVGADRRKDQFLAMLAHELRNPLAPIRNAVELMRQVETLDPSFQPSREMVERQVKHLARLVDDLLDVSRINQGSIRLRKEVLDLGTIVQRAVEGTRAIIESRAHTLSVQLPAEPVRLEADPTRLEQVISNLLNNAAKYTMPGGHVWVTAGREEEEAVVRVRDTGIGVPPDVLERVFEPFVQSDGSLARSDGGLGVGLTLVRSLVEMHGGRVEATSPGLGQGSEFVLRLPAQLPSEPALPAEPTPAAASRGLRVLVVEDNIDAAESLATLLRLWNHDVNVVHDGRMALEAAREQQPEVVLLDIGLPGLDGYQVARRLRDEIGLDHALLVAMTGYGQPEDRRRSQEAGIQYHFVKPVEPLVLRNLLAGSALPAGWESGRPF